MNAHLWAGKARTALWGVATVIALLGAGAVQAAIDTGKGTWYGTDGTDGTLLGRDIAGNPVNLLDGTGTAPNLDLVFVYDTQLQLTWLANWNVNGEMDWNAASTWAAGLTVGSFSGWSLPVVQNTAAGCDFSTAGGTGCGYNVYGSEAGRRGTVPPANTTGSPLAHMYYDTLGNLGFCAPGDEVCSSPQPGWGLGNTGPFSNMQSGVYWSGTAFSPSPSARSWYFFASRGLQGYNVQSLPLYAVAVRPGDVHTAVTPVPEPGTYAMLLVGLAAVAAIARRRAP